jgi:transmembrane sensor
MTEERITYLLQRYLHRQISEAELHELTAYFLENDDNTAFHAAFEKLMTTGPYPETISQADRDAIFQQIAGEPAAVAPVRRLRIWRMVAAAAILFMVYGLWFMVDRRGGSAPAVVDTPVVKDVLPGGNRAILQLADGADIVLDSAGNGLLTKQGDVKVVKVHDGELKYSPQSIVDSREPIHYNTLRTPRGGQYQLTLPDGTKVWLNAASSIRFPTTFNAKERKVSVTGEVYFEVASALLPSRSVGGATGRLPFIVDVNGKASVEVLGTHFNINAYDDEPDIRTTLLEGSVRLTRNAERITLKPSEQAVAAAHSPLTIHHSPDIDNVMAWKNGLFNLQDMSVQEVARQLERWYDIEVKYEGKPPVKNFQGKLSRGVQLSAIMNWFSKLGIHNKFEGRTLTLRADQ